MENEPAGLVGRFIGAGGRTRKQAARPNRVGSRSLTSTICSIMRRPSLIFVALVVALVAGGWATWTGWGNPNIAVFVFVTAGWLVSLCLHEFAHAYVAYHSGDRSVEEQGYLTLNPLRYGDALLSVALPLLFVLVGGLGLPGGAVRVHPDALRSRLRQALVSAAGPLANVVVVLPLLAVLVLVGPSAGTQVAFWSGLAFLVFLEVTVILLSLLPIPGLDGYGMVEPWLPRRWVRSLAPLSGVGLLLLVGLLWIPEVNRWFFQQVFQVLGWLGVPEFLVRLGLSLFRFWA
jgi:Zn-dependent protease